MIGSGPAAVDARAVGPAAEAAGRLQAGHAGRPGTLGILGGGQLARMFTHSAQRAGWVVVVLDPDAGSPAGAAANHQLVAAYDDLGAMEQLAARCAAVTTEFENVPAPSLEAIARAGSWVSPGGAAVRRAQHRALEKSFFASVSVPCAPYLAIEAAADAQAAARRDELFPAILKTSTLGYDGKGQVDVRRPADLAAAWQGLGARPSVLEQRVPLALELSVVVARGADGACVHLPVQQNLHRDGILAVTQVPGPDVTATAAEQAIGHAHRIAQALDYVGVLCVEFFVLHDGRVLANEMAPRPHNSGHYSIDACDVSQFELQWRAMCRWPLPAPRQHSAAVMLNLLGDLWFDAAGVPRDPPFAEVASLPGAHLHLYGKRDARPGRKMGHLTFTGPDRAAALDSARRAAARLGLPPF